VARAHSVLFTGSLSLEPPVNSDLLSVQPILVTCTRLAIREVNDVCAVAAFCWFAKLDGLINFILYPVSMFIPGVKHFT
jgi:hypothetical protein